MDEKVMSRIAFWGRFMGIVTMIMGVLSGICGLFAFVVGAIPGVLSIITGYFIYKSGSQASHYLRTPENGSLEGVLQYYSKYLLIQGILLIAAIVLLLISFIFMGTFVMMGLHQVMSLR